MSKLKKEADLEKLPDPRKHQIVSFIKSGIRILGIPLKEVLDDPLIR